MNGRAKLSIIKKTEKKFSSLMLKVYLFTYSVCLLLDLYLYINTPLNMYI